ncbi:MAG: hypothetical protein ABJE95_24240 [Byssovorax sp.]
MKTNENGNADQAYFTDSNSPNTALTLEQIDYDPAKFPLDPRDGAAIEALAPGETYAVQYAEEDDEAPTWGTIARLPTDTTVRALVRDGAVLGMGFDDATACQDAVDRDADSADVAAGQYVDGTLAALSGWGDVLIGPESVALAPDGCVRRIDVGDGSGEEPSIVTVESFISAAGITFALINGGEDAGRYFHMTASEGDTRGCLYYEEALALAQYLRSAGVDARPAKLTMLQATVVATGVLLEQSPRMEAQNLRPVVLPRAECKGVAAFLVTEAPKTNTLFDYFGPEDEEIYATAWAWRDAPGGSEPAKEDS